MSLVRFALPALSILAMRRFVWIVKRRGNTSLFPISHAAMNGLAMVRIVAVIVG